MTRNANLLRKYFGRRSRAVGMDGAVIRAAALVALMIVVLAVWYGGLRHAEAQAVQLVKVDVALVAKGYRASELIGASVKNDKNDKIGSIDDLIVDKQKVLYAILQVGGFLGVGGRLVAIPYEQLAIDDAGKNITLPGATKESLQNLDEFKYRTS